MRIQTIDTSGSPVIIDNFPDERGEELTQFARDNASRFGVSARDMEPMTHLVGQLAYLETEARPQEYEERFYRVLLPGGCVTSEAGEWAETVLHRTTDRTGKGRRVHPSANNIPMANVATSQAGVSVSHNAIGYAYSLQQIRQSVRYLTPLPAADQQAAVEGAEDHINDVALIGEVESNFKGLLNYSTVDANTRASGADWSAATADTIASDINTVLGNVFVKSKQKYPPSVLVIPPSRVSRLMQLRSTGVNETVMKWLTTNNLYTNMTGKPLTIIPGPSALETLGGSATKRCLAYTPNPLNVKFHLPMPQRFMAPQMDGLMVIVYSEYRLGGLDFAKIYTAEYMDGV
jgi:hypothetical protein